MKPRKLRTPEYWAAEIGKITKTGYDHQSDLNVLVQAIQADVFPKSRQIAETEAEQIAWEWFAEAHPHEAYAKDPERFWTFFHSKQPDMTREEMVNALRATDEA